jgi:uncharacterized protein
MVDRRRLLVLAAALAALPGAARGQVARERDMALIEAAARDDEAAVRTLLAAGASVRATDGRGRTALIAAAYARANRAAALLIAAGADVNVQDANQESAFFLAGQGNNVELLRQTIRAGADIRRTNRFGGILIIPVAERGHVEAMVELLKMPGVPVNHVNRLGWTALMEAVILADGGARHQEIVRLLLAAKADPNIPDKDGVTPLQHARRRGYAEIARLLEAAGGR